MHLDAGGVQRHRFDPDAHQLLALQRLEHLVEHAGLGPAAHARIDRVPVAESLGQPTPLAAVLRNKQHRVDHLQVAHADIAALLRQAVLDAGKLLGRDFHEPQCRPSASLAQLVLTRPRRALRRKVTRQPHEKKAFSDTEYVTIENAALASSSPRGLAICSKEVSQPRLLSSLTSPTMSVAPPPSPPRPTPCRNLRMTRRTGAVTPMDAYVGSSPMSVVPTPMTSMVAMSVPRRPRRSPMWPNMAAPSGHLAEQLGCAVSEV